jgi:hypothetical protein
MNKRINYLKSLQKTLELFTDGSRVLDESIDRCSEIGFRAKLNEYLLQYAQLNFDFSSYIIFKLSEAYSKDKEEQEFNDLIKGLEEDIDGNK